MKECTYQLKVNKCGVDDIGKYSVIVLNDYGDAESNVSRV